MFLGGKLAEINIFIYIKKNIYDIFVVEQNPPKHRKRAEEEVEAIFHLIYPSAATR